MATPSIASEAQSISHENKSEWLQSRPGERCLIRVSAAETKGAYSAVEIVADPGCGTPMHIHQKEDEHYLILEGTARFAYGDKIWDAATGEAVTLSRGVPHGWCNLSSSPLRVLMICRPGGFEEIFRFVAERGDIDGMTLLEKFGIRVIGPMLEGSQTIAPPPS